MRSLNKVMLIGNVGAEVKINAIKSGKVAHVSLATNQKYKDAAGVEHTSTQWHRLTFFGNLAGIVEQYVKPGMALYVEGELRYSQKGEGAEAKYFTEINVRDMNMLSGGKEGGSSAAKANSRGATNRTAVEDTAAVTAGAGNNTDDDLPF